jgi:hypothetical protein
LTAITSLNPTSAWGGEVKMRRFIQTRVAGAWLALGLAGCQALAVGMPDTPCEGSGCGPQSLDAQGADAPGSGGQPLACREALSGELVINEVLLRPGGIDIDGDGKSNGRDEAIEVWNRADVAVQLPGARLFYSDEERGELSVPGCVPPGAVGVIVGGTTSPGVQPAAGAAVWRLDRSLRLTDTGGHLELRGGRGQLLADAALGPAGEGLPSSVVRATDGDPHSDFVVHRERNDAGAAAHTLGACSNGLLPPGCVDRP